jgi:hypothetical protein
VVLLPFGSPGTENWISQSIVKIGGREKLTLLGLNCEEGFKKAGRQITPNRYEFNEQVSGSD